MCDRTLRLGKGDRTKLFFLPKEFATLLCCPKLVASTLLLKAFILLRLSLLSLSHSRQSLRPMPTPILKFSSSILLPIVHLRLL